MDTIYYRKIAEIAIRDASGEPAIYDLATRAISAKRINKPDRRALRAFMMTWIENKTRKHERSDE